MVYRLIIYITKSQPLASIKLNATFKLMIQANNYLSLYDETNQAWSIMFDQESTLIQCVMQLTLVKFNLQINQESGDHNKILLIQD